MRLTVLGNTRRYLAPRSAGSGYLLETGGKRVLLDCGGGIADSLENVPLDAIVISHFHHDHVLDLLRLRDSLPDGMPIVVPPGERSRFADFGRAFSFRGPFELPGPIVEATPGEHLVAGVRMRFVATLHSAPSFATRIGSLVYASDSAPCNGLRELAVGCDTLLVHTLLASVDPSSGHAERHMTAQSAGELARAARPKRLMLSHRYHASKDDEMLCAAGFSGTELAEDRGSYAIPS
ncbi:MAG: MBL fold metallo-hydrolase [Candidatus Thermoplasmatota archaeon]